MTDKLAKWALMVFLVASMFTVGCAGTLPSQLVAGEDPEVMDPHMGGAYMFNSDGDFD